MRRFKSLQVGILGLSIFSMVLQVLVSSAHIHGLDGDTFHQLHGSASNSLPKSSTHQRLSHRAHRPHTDHDGHVHHHRHDRHHGHRARLHAAKVKLTHQPVDALDNHRPENHSDDEHVPWHMCEFSLLFGAFASLSGPVTTEIVPPAQTRGSEFAIRQRDTGRGLRWRAHGARAPPSQTA